MTEQEIARQTLDYISELHGGGAGQFSLEAPLLEDGIIDSQGLVDLITFLEKQFSIHIQDDDVNLENFTSVSSIASFVAATRENHG